MPRYKAQFTQTATVVEVIQIEVEAETPEEAAQKAMAEDWSLYIPTSRLYADQETVEGSFKWLK